MMTDDNDMVDDPVIWTSFEHSNDQEPTVWVCDIGNGAIRMKIARQADGWAVFVMGSVRTITVRGQPDRSAAMHEAETQARRMVQDINDQMVWLFERAMLRNAK